MNEIKVSDALKDYKNKKERIEWCYNCKQLRKVQEFYKATFEKNGEEYNVYNVACLFCGTTLLVDYVLKIKKNNIQLSFLGDN